MYCACATMRGARAPRCAACVRLSVHCRRARQKQLWQPPRLRKRHMRALHLAVCFRQPFCLVVVRQWALRHSMLIESRLALAAQVALVVGVVGEAPAVAAHEAVAAVAVDVAVAAVVAARSRMLQLAMVLRLGRTWVCQLIIPSSGPFIECPGLGQDATCKWGL